jgi:hypothetical protein
VSSIVYVYVTAAATVSATVWTWRTGLLRGMWDVQRSVGGA